MTDMDRNSFDRVSEPGQFDWGLVVMLVALVGMATLLLLAVP